MKINEMIRNSGNNNMTGKLFSLRKNAIRFEPCYGKKMPLYNAFCDLFNAQPLSMDSLTEVSSSSIHCMCRANSDGSGETAQAHPSLRCSPM